MKILFYHGHLLQAFSLSDLPLLPRRAESVILDAKVFAVRDVVHLPTEREIHIHLEKLA